MYKVVITRPVTALLPNTRALLLSFSLYLYALPPVKWSCTAILTHTHLQTHSHTHMHICIHIILDFLYTHTHTHTNALPNLRSIRLTKLNYEKKK